MRICVITPSYSGLCNVHFMISMMATITRVKKSECTFFANLGCSILPAARNSLVARALAWGADKVVMIDDDISWRPEDFQKLVLAPERIVAGVYQKKPHDIEAAKSPEMALSVFPEGLQVDHRGLAEVDGAATGFMRVDREVFEALKPHRMHLADDTLDPESQKHMYEYFCFDRLIKDGKTYLQGEDYGFCRAARAAGFRTYIDPSIKLGHHMGGFKFGASIEPTHLL